MFLPIFTVLSLGIAAFVAGAPRSEPAPHPQTQLAFLSTLVVDTANFRKITIPEGTRLNVDVRGGNWTKPDGTLLANVVGGLGGEHGYIDSTGVFHLSARYTVQFVQDSKFGYIQMQGFGTPGTQNKVFITLESDSAAATGLIEQILYAPGKFVGNLLVAPHWAFV
ncbi:hypothetical protein BS47DRAFT_214594 [Hydnum rufescens UP504]|uniref:Uncharacterized protein n=1 Tax=Hydnum rufescens UP504 TaxID=1448309 RepID=A0A9P6AMT8_9AGAM|nr:hypothetical protein BS47DRAFT_214594 [Hydnum rufescens UP504]